MIAASHSHSAGPTGMILPGEYDQDSDLVKSLAYEKSSIADAKYLAEVEQAIIAAVVEADSRKVPRPCEAGVGSEDKVAFNRRFRMTGGLTMTHPGQGNPDILEPAGPTDPQVGVVGAWDTEGKFLGCIVNFCCHATTGPGGISADYVYYIEKTIRGLMGDEAIVVFVPGMAGDVTQVDNRSPFSIKQFGEVSARFVGGRVGAEALKVLLAMEQGAGAIVPVAFESRTLEIPRRKPRPERLERALQLVSQDPKNVDATEWTFAKEIVLLDARLRASPSRRSKCKRFNWPRGICFLPGRVFLPVRARYQSGEPVPVYVSRVTGQRLRGLCAHGRSTRPARRRIRDAAHEL